MYLPLLNHATKIRLLTTTPKKVKDNKRYCVKIDNMRKIEK